MSTVDFFPARSPSPSTLAIIKFPTMANPSYLRVWTRDFSTETMIAEFARFLTTAPLSTTKGTFTELIVQPVDPTEPAAAEWDLRAANAGPAQVAVYDAADILRLTIPALKAKDAICLADRDPALAALEVAERHGPLPALERRGKRLLAEGEGLRHPVGVERQHHVEHGDVDKLPLTGARARLQRQYSSRPPGGPG